MDKEQLSKIIKDEVHLYKEAKQRETLSEKQKLAFEQRITKLLIEKEGKCVKCGRTDALTLDHIVPSFLLLCFGIDVKREIIPDNYQILCKSCNHFKSGRLDFSTPKTKEVLLRLLD